MRSPQDAAIRMLYAMRAPLLGALRNGTATNDERNELKRIEHEIDRLEMAEAGYPYEETGE